MAVAPLCHAAPARPAAAGIAEKRGTALAAVALALLFFTCPAAARTWVVRPGGSIQGAIDRAGSGDVILILPGEYRERLVIEGKRLTLQGIGAGRTAVTLVAPTLSADPVIGLDVEGEGAAGTRLANLDITVDPASSVNVAIRFGVDAELLGCHFANIGDPPSERDRGIAVQAENSAAVRIAACSFEDCSTALSNSAGRFDVLDTTFARCFKAVTGPSCTSGNSISVWHSTFVDCQYGLLGGGHQAAIDNCRFERCSSGIVLPCSDVVIRDTEFVDHGVGQDREDPAIQSGSSQRGSGVIQNCTFRGAAASTSVPLVQVGSTARIEGCAFEHNQRAAISVFSGMLDVIASSFVGNTGPGVRFASGTIVHITGCEFLNNPGPWGQIASYSSYSAQVVELHDCLFRGNSFVSAPLIDGPVTLIDACRFDRNVSSTQALVTQAHRIASSHFVQNASRDLIAAEFIEGGAFLGNSVSRLMLFGTLTNCVMVGNTGYVNRTSFAGCTIVSNPDLYTAGATLTGCIARDNDSRFIATTLYSNSNRGSHPASGPGNIDADPLFVRSPSPGPDQTWGTPDDDYGDLRLQPGSPCIDAADSTAFDDDIATDLAGAPRFVDDPATPDTGLPDDSPPRAVADMGAFEFQPDPEPPAPVCDVDLDGQVDVRDLLRFLHRWTSGDPAADLDGDGEVDVLDLLEFLDCFTNTR